MITAPADLVVGVLLDELCAEALSQLVDALGAQHKLLALGKCGLSLASRLGRSLAVRARLIGSRRMANALMIPIFFGLSFALRDRNAERRRRAVNSGGSFAARLGGAFAVWQRAAHDRAACTSAGHACGWAFRPLVSFTHLCQPLGLPSNRWCRRDDISDRTIRVSLLNGHHACRLSSAVGLIRDGQVDRDFAWRSCRPHLAGRVPLRHAVVHHEVVGVERNNARVNAARALFSTAVPLSRASDARCRWSPRHGVALTARVHRLLDRSIRGRDPEVFVIIILAVVLAVGRSCGCEVRPSERIRRNGAFAIS